MKPIEITDLAKVLAKVISDLVLRIIGLVGLLYTCRHMYMMIHKTGSWHLGWLIHSWDKTGTADVSELRALLFEIVLIAFGVYLLQGAPRLMKFMYPEKKKDAPDHGTETQG